MALGFLGNLRASRLDAITTYAGNGALLRLYSGTKPVTTGGTATTLLAELTCGTPFAGAANTSTGVLTLTVPISGTGASAAGAGTAATWFRIVKADGSTIVMDGTVGTASTDLIMPNTTIASGQPVQVTSFTITEANT